MSTIEYQNIAKLNAQNRLRREYAKLIVSTGTGSHFSLNVSLVITSVWTCSATGLLKNDCMINPVMHHTPCSLHLFPFSPFPYIFFYPPICVVYIVDSWLFELLHHYVYQRIGYVTMEHRRFNRGFPSSVRCFICNLALSAVLLFSLCWYFANKYMDGWMNEWMETVVYVCSWVKLNA